MEAIVLAVIAVVVVGIVASRLLGTEVRVEVRSQVVDARDFSRELMEQAATHLGAHPVGDPAALESALAGFLPAARALARRHGLTLDDAGLRLLVANAVGATGAADRAHIDAALDRLARRERNAA